MSVSCGSQWKPYVNCTAPVTAFTQCALRAGYIYDATIRLCGMQSELHSNLTRQQVA